jgi:tripeptidyl-peptidase-1
MAENESFETCFREFILWISNEHDSSDPRSPKYGQYWSSEEVHDMFAPPEESVETVKEWLVTFGIHDARIVHSDNKGWLAFDATVEEMEGLLMAEFYEHEHKFTPSIRVGTDK